MDCSAGEFLRRDARLITLLQDRYCCGASQLPHRGAGERGPRRQYGDDEHWIAGG